MYDALIGGSIKFKSPKMKLNTIFVIILSLFSCTQILGQCNWTSVDFESYEYNSPIPYLIPGTTYGDGTPQSYAGCTHTGNYGAYLNVVDGYSGIIYSQTFDSICADQAYKISFFTRDAWTSMNNLSVVLRDGNGNILDSINVMNNSNWQNVETTPFSVSTSQLTFEIYSNIPGAAGNDVGLDDLTLWQCQPIPYSSAETECGNTGSVDLFNLISSTFSSSGSWSGPSNLSNGYLGTFMYGMNVNGLYTYTISGAIGCADSTANIQISMNLNPVIDQQNDTAVCGYYVLPAIGGQNLSGSEGYYTGANGTGINYLPGDTLFSSQTVYAYDDNSGCTDQKSFSVAITPQPILSPSTPGPVCAGEEVTLSVFYTSSSLDVTWQPGNFYGDSLILYPNESLTYTASGIDASGCLSNSVVINVIVNPVPDLFISSSDTVVCETKDIVLTANTDAENGMLTWFNGSNDSIINFALTDEQLVTLNVVDNNGCSSNDTLLIDLVNCNLDFCFHIPNVFTPNGDGLNEHFEIELCENIDFLSFVIVNRWGNTIRTFDKSDFKWNGITENGIMVSEGVYFYEMKYLDNDKQMTNKSGFIAIYK